MIDTPGKREYDKRQGKSKEENRMKKVLIGSVLTLVSSLCAAEFGHGLVWKPILGVGQRIGGRRTAGRVPAGVGFGIGDPGRRVFSEREIKAEI